MICVYLVWILISRRRTSSANKSDSAYSVLPTNRSGDSIDDSAGSSSDSSESDFSSWENSHSSTSGRSSKESSSSISNGSNRKHQKRKRMSSGDLKRREDSPAEAKVAYQPNMNEETFSSADSNRANVTSRATGKSASSGVPACRLKAEKNCRCHHYSVEQQHIEPAERLIERQTSASPQRKPASQLELQLAQPNLKQQPALERPVWRAVLCARCYRLLNAISPTFAHYERHCGYRGCQFCGQPLPRCGCRRGRLNVRVESNCNRNGNAREAHCSYLKAICSSNQAADCIDQLNFFNNSHIGLRSKFNHRAEDDSSPKTELV